MMRSLGGQFLLIFLPLAAITGTIVAAVYWGQQRTEERLLELDQRGHVDLMARLVVSDFRAAASDLMFLAEGPTLQAFLSTPGRAAPANLPSLAEEFRLLSQHKQLYDQIRYIDAEGNEVVRVNLVRGTAQVVPKEKLQTKIDRYYFAEAIRLGRGELFLSPFDLNVEEGRIEIPHKPTIRFAAPAFDAGGKKRGIVVLNYLGERLLARLAETAAGSAGRPMLVNREGYWIKGLATDDEWGFMYPERQGATMARRHPEAWQRIVAGPDGSVRTSDGLFTFATARHAQRAIGSDATSGEAPRTRGAYEWKVISLVSDEAIASRRADASRGMAVLSGGLAVVMATVSWLLASANMRHRTAQTRALEAERLAAIGEAMTALAHESRNALQRSQAGLEMLARRIADRPEAVDLLGEIQQAQYQLRDMYEQVRDYAAPVNLRRTAVDVGQLVEETWGQLEVVRRDRRVSLELGPTGADATVQADRGRLRQVIRNILENALAASPTDARTDARIDAKIAVEFADVAVDGKAALQIAVRDAGPGLSEDVRRRLFEPFFTTKERGTGLGTTIARRFVEAHGGTIGIGAGPGTTVVITLPRA